MHAFDHLVPIFQSYQSVHLQHARESSVFAWMDNINGPGHLSDSYAHRSWPIFLCSLGASLMLLHSHALSFKSQRRNGPVSLRPNYPTRRLYKPYIRFTTSSQGIAYNLSELEWYWNMIGVWFKKGLGLEWGAWRCPWLHVEWCRLKFTGRLDSTLKDICMRIGNVNEIRREHEGIALYGWSRVRHEWDSIIIHHTPSLSLPFIQYRYYRLSKWLVIHLCTSTSSL